MASEDIPSLTLAVLREIRDEVRNTNGRIDQTNGRLDQTVHRLDQTVDRLDQTIDRIDRLERRQVEMEVRLSTELVAVTGAVRELGPLLKEDRAMRAKVDNHDQRIAALEKKVG